MDNQWQNMILKYCVVVSASLVLKHMQDFQIAYEGVFWALCTVTFWQKIDFLISNWH